MSLKNRLLRALHGQRLAVWYHPDYRLSLPSLEGQLGLEPRRADHAAWYLVESGAVAESDLRVPERIGFEELARVHTPAWLDALTRPEALAAVFSVPEVEARPDALMGTVRLAVGGTLAAARHALEARGPALNLLGGFHHAFPDKGGGLCPVNDLAVALAALRAEGFAGQAVVIDLDAHPPDGTAACLVGDGAAWVGSLSGSDWGPVPGADETVLPKGTGDEGYLAALAALLSRMPTPELAFVIAGGDVLSGDRFGLLGLSLAGVAARDRLVAEALRGVPSVWVPGGGYSEAAWRVLAGTGLVLALGRAEAIPASVDPLAARFGALFRALRPEDLGEEPWLTEADLGFGGGDAGPARFLGYYSAEGIELGLHHYGVLGQIRRLGYENLHVLIDSTGAGERFRLMGRAGEGEHAEEQLLVEAVLGRERLPGGATVLYVHWLTLRHPLGRFSGDRPRLPGQEQPGLGLAREASELLERIAERLGLAGVALRPAYFHVAYACRARFRFADPARQGRFEALIRDLSAIPLLEATIALSEGRVRCNGEVYTWEADLMVHLLAPSGGDEAAVAAAREGVRFSLRPG